MKLKRRHRGVPGLQMAAMPDLIFTVLFFFMIVTHMRENTLQVECRKPVGDSLVKITNKAAVINIYVGWGKSGEFQVQVGNELVPLEVLPATLRSACDEVPADLADHLAASLQADSQVPMAYINKVKAALREARILNIRYEGMPAGGEQNEK